jgi:hypothetical protein
MPLYHLTIRAAVLLFPLFCAKSIFARTYRPTTIGIPTLYRLA